jgi:hypothetical protein
MPALTAGGTPALQFDMDIGAIGGIYLPLFFVFAIAFYALRYRARRKKGFYPTYSDAGNAFQELQKIAQPRVQYVLQEKKRDDASEDDEGEPKEPGKG